MPPENAYKLYRKDLIDRYWKYKTKIFPNISEYFEEPPSINRPPVFKKEKSYLNIITNKKNEQIDRIKLLKFQKKKHRWFSSMNSSQALALSVLGNLAIYNRLKL